jgi:hypothetical protein
MADVDVLFPSFCRCTLKIKYGSDDEKALTKAIDSVFPASKRSLCNKHLKDNVSDYLKNKIGVNTKDRVICK